MALAEELELGLELGRINLAVLVDHDDVRDRGIGKVDDLLGAHVPPHLDALGLQLGNVYNGSTQLHVKLCAEFLASCIVDHSSHFCDVVDQILVIDHCRSCRKGEWGGGSCTTFRQRCQLQHLLQGSQFEP
jgi:hypothetical protein